MVSIEQLIDDAKCCEVVRKPVGWVGDPPPPARTTSIAAFSCTIFLCLNIAGSKLPGESSFFTVVTYNRLPILTGNKGNGASGGEMGRRPNPTHCGKVSAGGMVKQVCGMETG
jgi:hypothetical protein